jgi:hypothetical protein
MPKHTSLQIGDRVCLAAHTTEHNLEAVLAVTALGAICAPLNWRWTAGEAGFAMQLVGARCLIADAACFSLASRLMSQEGGTAGSAQQLVLLGALAEYKLEELVDSSVCCCFAGEYQAPERYAILFLEAVNSPRHCTSLNDNACTLCSPSSSPYLGYMYMYCTQRTSSHSAAGQGYT